MHLCKYFVLSFLFNVLLFETFAFPLTEYVRRQAISSNTSEPTSAFNITHEIQTIETTQSSTSSDGITVRRCTIIGKPTTLPNGEPAVIIAQNCSSTFIPSLHSSTAPAESISSMPIGPPSDPPSSSPASSIFSTSAVATSVAPPSITNSVSGSFSSPTSSSIFSTSTSINTSINTSSSVTNNDASGGHLSSLPIFLGAFGGVATLALVIVGCTVYRPFKRLNNARLNPPACIKRMRKTSHRQSDFSVKFVPEKHVDSPALYAFKTG